MKFIVEMFDKTEVSFWNSNAASMLISFLGIIISAVVTGILTYLINKKLNEKSEGNQKRINEDNLKVQKQISEQNIKIQKEISKDNIDANLIASARIRWIEDTRKMLSEYIRLCYELSARKIIDGDLKNHEEVAILILNMYKTQHLLTMSIPKSNSDDSRNDNFIGKINDLNVAASNAYNKPNANIHESVKELSNYAREYFKTDWEKAKLGK